jgi:hypothetical protein
MGTGKLFIPSDGHREIIYFLRWAQENYKYGLLLLIKIHEPHILINTTTL